MDETGHTFRAPFGTTWAPVGHPPVLKRISQRREISSIVALIAPTPRHRAQLFARHFEGTVKKPRVLISLRYFQRQVRRPLVVVWDRLPTHRAREVQDFFARHPDKFREEWLPSYAPEVNPEEQCNGYVKKQMLNALPDSIRTMRRMVVGAFSRLQHKPRVLRAFFPHAGLGVTRFP